MAMLPDDTTCALCSEPIWIRLGPESGPDSDDDDDDMLPQQGASASRRVVAEEDDEQVVPDDVVLHDCPASHHFHWQCFLSHTEPETYCPACHVAIIPPDDDDARLLATIRNEGGQEDNFDLRPVLVEERLFATAPHLRTHAALCSACFTGDEASVLDILSNPSLSPPETTHLLNTSDTDKHWTPLFYAAVAGHADIVAFLLNHGADPNHRDRFEHVPAEYASEEGHAEVLDLLRGARSVY